MTQDHDADPLLPWLRELAETHAAERHGSGRKCRGSVEYIDEAARLRGVAAVRHGKTISLSKEIETRPGKMAAGQPAVDLSVEYRAHGRSVHGLDTVSYVAHGAGKTHMDGLGHFGADGTWHGDVPVEASDTDEDTIVAWAAHGIATRAVLLDVAAARGVDWIVGGEPVTADELDKALEATGVALEPGDALLLYQGRDRYEAAGNSYPSGTGAEHRPGLGNTAAQWIAAKRPGLVAWDFLDARNVPHSDYEVHNLIFAIGLCLIDNSLLGPAAAALKAAGTSTGLLVAAPTPIHRSTGVIVNPLVLY